jgi:hypothetical protein
VGLLAVLVEPVALRDGGYAALASEGVSKHVLSTIADLTKTELADCRKQQFYCLTESPPSRRVVVCLSVRIETWATRKIHEIDSSGILFVY